ncbi:FtsX-like permease family protein [Actinomadura alba]|uniref:FtsX-like permease family protein n=1 Tax=Actinomadura alba TaxID=406431 RepID=A0ABR7LL21_9ACTN|nr:FtsX-like permease family protein [Actinomadura alba]MBC6465190.1 FtsX-like permease family protein [Actinomadura alba]
MGRLVLILRLATRDLRRRRVEALLLLVALAATTTTLTMGLAVRGVTDRPWERTRAATAGPDAVVTSTSVPASITASASALTGLARSPGVTAMSGPYTMRYYDDLRVRDLRVATTVQGRDAVPSAVDRPRVTDGAWVRDGAVVVERAFADALKVRPGDTVTIAGRRLSVGGIAVTTARAPYPNSAPGLIWASEADAARLAPAAENFRRVVYLRLADPGSAPAFAARGAAGGSTPGVQVVPWQEVRAGGTAELTLVRTALFTGAWALALLAVASVAVLVGGRMADQTRRVGLLKAVGATPRLVAVVLLAEHVMLALAAAAVGLGVGRLVAPSLTRPGDGLLGVGNPPSLTLATAVVVVLAAVGVAGVATVFPAVRGARTSTLRALAGTTRAPRHRSRLTALSARLPVPLLLGVRLAARRPRRTALAAVSLTITVAMVVAALAMWHDVGVNDARINGSVDFVQGAGNPVTERLEQVTVAMMLALLALAAVNAILIAWATAVDTLRPTALARALGASPRQVASGLSAAQLLPALAAGIAGIPAGSLVYRFAQMIAGGQGSSGYSPPLPWLLAVVAGTLAGVAVLTGVPVRAAARRPVAEVLRSD